MQKNQKNIRLSEMLKSPEMNLVQQLLPLDPYNLRTNKALAAMAVQLNLFDSGDMGIGICIYTRLQMVEHSLLSSMLGLQHHTVLSKTLPPCLNSATIFPPRDI